MPASIFDGLGETVLETFKEPEQASYLSQIPLSQPVTLDCIFNARHQEKDYEGVVVGAPRPVAWFATGEIEPKYGDSWTVAGVTYKIIDVKPDGLELTELGLQAP